ncbi:hypothetical protein Tco_0110443 [Tanacetum coccineum]
MYDIRSKQSELKRSKELYQTPQPSFEDALCVFNMNMETDLLSNPSEIDAPKLMKQLADMYVTKVTKTAESTFSSSPQQMALWESQRGDQTSDWLPMVLISSLGQTINGINIYEDHAVSCADIIGIKHRHNVVIDNLVDIYMLLYSWDRGLDVCIDLTGSSPLTQTRMTNFVLGREVIDAVQRKCVKYDTKCATIEYGFLPFSFSSLGELKEDVVTLLKWIQSYYN